ncbi:hypothetical protein EJ04DRAFT_565782 [Polyplosphaeria fusca]|uniref:Uncharacterized protein n=1 Tax=Polyplosphaeria fusca TaxID=682080 RepID=A0A9P4V133_9PLEO|nr:hypothetical protein EJ04DRAFT_565782 [Polyplosphaeria fusca]
MKLAVLPLLLALACETTATATPLQPRDDYGVSATGLQPRDDYSVSHWKPKTKNPHFFTLFVNQRCKKWPYWKGKKDWKDKDHWKWPKDEEAGAASEGSSGTTAAQDIGAQSEQGEEQPDPESESNSGLEGRDDPKYKKKWPHYGCKFNGYAVRLDKGRVIVTPYNKWWDPKLPVFFVDDDTQMYTVSKHPLQLYVDSVTGALKYTKVGWLPPNAIAVGFYHTGDNPLGLIDESPSYLTWPITYGYSQRGIWKLCDIGQTGQYQVYINSKNFKSQGVVDTAYCESFALAAVNANPWKKGKKHHGHGGGYSRSALVF